MVITEAPTRSVPRIRSTRIAQGLSQQELAEKAQCSIGYVRHVEGGYTPRSDADTYRRILAALDLDPINGERHPAQDAAAKTTAEQGRHESE